MMKQSDLQKVANSDQVNLKKFAIVRTLLIHIYLVGESNDGVRLPLMYHV